MCHQLCLFKAKPLQVAESFGAVSSFWRCCRVSLGQILSGRRPTRVQDMALDPWAIANLELTPTVSREALQGVGLVFLGPEMRETSISWAWVGWVEWVSCFCGNMDT